MNKKYIIAGLIGTVTILGAIAYLQFQKIKDYCLSINKIKLNGFGLNGVDIDLFMNFVNKSELKLKLLSQTYLVYINDIGVAKISNSVPQVINPSSSSVVSAKLQFNPKQVLGVINKNAIDLAKNADSIKIKFIINMKVGFGILSFNVNQEYLTNLKELLSSSEPNGASKKC
jgi:LEA14-like dessication related protein